MRELHGLALLKTDDHTVWGAAQRQAESVASCAAYTCQTLPGLQAEVGSSSLCLNFRS